MARYSDLLEHYKLDMTQEGNDYIRTFYRSDPARNVRKEEVHERWTLGRKVGRGSCGQVHLLEKQRVDNSGHEKAGSDAEDERRAIKVLDKPYMERYRFDWKREIEALAKFDKAKASQITTMSLSTRLRTWS